MRLTVPRLLIFMLLLAFDTPLLLTSINGSYYIEAALNMLNPNTARYARLVYWHIHLKHNHCATSEGLPDCTPISLIRDTFQPEQHACTTERGGEVIQIRVKLNCNSPSFDAFHPRSVDHVQ
uniref:Putative secreted peptide n=1 Tax=Anopheles braziliensis TaxID=58242 RepID=A0A2M3ZUG0_9DIPT